MNGLQLRLLLAALSLSFLSPPGNADAVPRFLTLPFDGPEILIQQGWFYSTPGPFKCPPSQRGKRCHKGIDYVKGIIDQPDTWVGFDLFAAANGRAVQSVQSKKPGYGTFVYIAHDEVDETGLRYFTLYAHLAEAASFIPFKTVKQLQADIATGDFSSWAPVNRGTTIGRAGDSGTLETGVHLHFEVQRGGYPLNKTDPYDIYSTREYYPGGSLFTSCGSNFLWTQCPPGTLTGNILFTQTSSPTTIYVAAPENFSPIAVATDNVGWSAWFPDGVNVVYTQSLEIVTANLATHVTHSVISLECCLGALAVSPDGTQIAFVHSTSAFTVSDIKLVNVDGSNLRQLTLLGDVEAQQLSWSLDGQAILFTRTNGSYSAADWTLWVIKPDGSGIRQFVPTASARFGSWSKDGTRVAYNVGDQLVTDTQSGTAATPIASDCFYPSWSPDDLNIVCMTTVPFGDLVIMRADGWNPRNVTNTPAATEAYPQWSR